MRAELESGHGPGHRFADILLEEIKILEEDDEKVHEQLKLRDEELAEVKAEEAIIKEELKEVEADDRHVHDVLKRDKQMMEEVKEEVTKF